MKTLTTFVSLVLFAATLTLNLSAQNAQTKLFSVPAAGTGASQGTFPVAYSNNLGEIVGAYVDASNVFHGFSYANGHFTTMTPFGASFSVALGVNDGGSVVGYFEPPTNPHGQVLGFLRSPAGKYTLIQAASGRDANTVANAINVSGTIAGAWIGNVDLGSNCFVRSTDGTITTFTALENQGSCDATSINGLGTIAGFVDDQNVVGHGFVRDAEGNVTNFDPPNSLGTFAFAINASGQVAGVYLVTAPSTYNGFIYNTDGTFTTFAVPNAVSMDFAPTFGNQFAFNDSGEAAGTAVLTNGSVVGWRYKNGIVSTFQVCGQTGVTALTNLGHMTGFCGDSGQMVSYDGFTF